MRRLDAKASQSEAASSNSFRPKRLRERFFEKWRVGIEQRFDTNLFINDVSRFLKAFQDFYMAELCIAKV